MAIDQEVRIGGPFVLAEFGSEQGRVRDGNHGVQLAQRIEA